MKNDLKKVEKIGVVIAMQEEIGLSEAAFGKKVECADTYRGKPVMRFNSYDRDIFLAFCGAGEIGAAACTQMLIDRYDVDIVLNAGFVGSLSPRFKAGCVAVIEKAVHYDYDISGLQPQNAPGVYTELGDPYIPCDKELVDRLRVDHSVASAILASGDKFICDTGKKNALVETYHAELCDMEGAAVALTAYRNNVGCMLVKIVSDGADESSKEDFDDAIGGQSERQDAFETGADNLKRILDLIIKNS